METLIDHLLDLLAEVYIGSRGEESWVIDASPGHGFTAAINSINAEQASTPLVRGGSTIAAHTEHLRWSLHFALQFYKGEVPSSNWEESWKIRTVSEAEWQTLQKDLLDVYSTIKHRIASVNNWSDPFLLKGTLALLPHAAYHLGAIKQLMIAVTNND